MPTNVRWSGPSTRRSFASSLRGMPRARRAQRASTPIAPARKPRGGLPASWRQTSPHSHREKLAMQLTPQRLRQFAEEGYLFLPECFSEEEVAILRDEAEKIYATNRK